ncbi:MAG: hypothetical protein HQ504_02030 [Rhodospirillaceae bacterium]|nr:hypothetical protein [Rhodospirillaceae bacterium]
MAPYKKGWAWFGLDESATANNDSAATDKDLAQCFARCFRDRDGERVTRHLKAMTMEQALGPGAPDTVLRHLEGQRQLVAHILALIERGRGNSST